AIAPTGTAVVYVGGRVTSTKSVTEMAAGLVRRPGRRKTNSPPAPVYAYGDAGGSAVPVQILRRSPAIGFAPALRTVPTTAVSPNGRRSAGVGHSGCSTRKSAGCTGSGCGGGTRGRVSVKGSKAA